MKKLLIPVLILFLLLCGCVGNTPDTQPDSTPDAAPNIPGVTETTGPAGGAEDTTDGLDLPNETLTQETTKPDQGQDPTDPPEQQFTNPPTDPPVTTAPPTEDETTKPPTESETNPPLTTTPGGGIELPDDEF